MTRASSGLAVDGDTAFEAASLSKQVFAYLVHRLAFEGALDLDRPVAEYLPLPNPADERARTITARHLLSHSSGWRNWRFNKDQALTSEFAPGSRWSYSGEGYYFLQRVVEHVTRKGILAITSERIFAPLGMRRSGYMWTPELDLRRAEPHTGAGAPIESGSVRMAKELRASGRPMEEWRHEDAERAYTSQHEGAPALPVFLLPNVAASLMTTADDLGRFYAHLLGDAEGRRALEAMTAPQVRINEALQWGLGVGLEAVNGAPTRFWQWGDNTGFKHFLLGDRTGGGQALVVLTNGNSGRAVYERVIRRELGVDAAGFLII
jgi:CubicO group peptidase (beta-lactamase class C family)